MGRATVTAEILRLDTMSRDRPLTPRESEHLSKLIAVERRYDYSRHARSRKSGGPE